MRPKQLHALKIIAHYLDKVGRAPSYSELANGLGLRNRKSGRDYVQKLARDHLISVVQETQRTIQIRLTNTGVAVLEGGDANIPRASKRYRKTSTINEVLALDEKDFISIVNTTALETEGLRIGDKVVLRPAVYADVRQGEICLVRVNNNPTTTLRRVSFANGKFILSSSDPLFPTVHIDGTHVEVLAVLVARLRVHHLVR
ncbi:MAG: hypothetical protein KDD67_03160 [Ignavibacteriae bacterium]|nr:hypothetical protein [Ignavibacteriota bacterium]